MKRFKDFYKMEDYVGDRLDRFALAFQRRVCTVGISYLVSHTPVFTPKEGDPPDYPKKPGGRLRGSWGVSLDRPRLAARNSRRDPEGQTTIGKNTQRLFTFARPGRVYFSNPQPYAAKVEFGGFPNPPKNGTGRTADGFSTQAPSGMARIAMARMAAVAPQIAATTLAQEFA